MIVALVRPPLAVALVLGFFAFIVVGCLIAITAAKVHRERRTRLDGEIRMQLQHLPAQVALDDDPPAAPSDPRARRVARDMVIEATFALEGPARRRAIRWFEHNGYVSESIEQMRRSPWRALRPSLALRLGRMGSAQAAPILTDGLLDADYRVRDACTTALGRVAPKEFVVELVDALARRDVPRGVISNALLKLHADAEPELIRSLANPDAQVRELVAQVLGLRRSTLAVPTLMELVDDTAPAVRRESVLALASIAAVTDIAHAVDMRRLVRLSRDDASIVRSASATGLGTILGDAAAPILRELSHDEDYWVSHRAAESLCRLPSGIRFGWELLASSDMSPPARQAKTACLEWFERTGRLEERIEQIMARGDTDQLVVTLAVLEELGSRAWGDLHAAVPVGAGIPAETAGAAA